MFVELVAVFPVMVIVGLIAINLLWYMEASSAFMRLSDHAILVGATSQQGTSETDSQELQVKQYLEQGLKDFKRVSVEVSSQSVSRNSDGSHHFTLAPYLQRYTCTMTYKIWPGDFSLSFMDAQSPLELKAENSLVVDPYRSGVIF